MASVEELYRVRRMGAAQAVALVPHGAKVVMGLGVAQPPALLKALAERAAAEDLADVRIYYLLSTAIAGETVLRPELARRITPMSLFHSANERALDRADAKRGAMLSTQFIPAAFSQVPRLLCEKVGVDTLLTTVSPMDDEGYFSLGTNVDYALAVARRADRVLVEVNRHMPRVSGDCRIHISDVHAVVEWDMPLLEIPRTVRRPDDDAIGAIIAELIEDGACLQMGIGAVPEAACAALAGHRDLGIHTELITPSLVDLMHAGVVNNSRKTLHPGVSVFTFAMGDTPFYAFLNGNPDVAGYQVDYVNDPAVIAKNERMVSINATLQIDLHGACNSEWMDGQFSGSGGQLDFVRGAFAAKDGRSIIACHSTACNGMVSRIVPRLDGPVTTPRNDTHIVVTEFGWADLKGLSLRERAEALIKLAHPKFRSALEAAAS